MSILSRVVRIQMRHNTEVDDIIQETVLKALARLAQFRREAGFRAWLIQIAINESPRSYQKSARSRVSILDQSTLAEMELVDLSPLPLERFERQERSGDCL
ncbi:MAG TPA: sigma factor [Edaphobacter sp.]|nr:sigma factor [Edaphobacter sp.]